MNVRTALDRVRAAPFALDAMAEADALAAACAASDGSRTARTLLDAAVDPDDQLTAIAAVHGLARVFDDAADAGLADLLSHPAPFLREHAAWALGSRLPHLSAVGRLVGVVAGGGFPGMVAQRTLQRWARSAADHVALAVEGALAGGGDPRVRARLVETIGLVPGVIADRVLRSVAVDPSEPVVVRAAGLAALGDRGDERDLALVDRVVAEADHDELAAVAALARVDLLHDDLARVDLLRDVGAPLPESDDDRPTVAQLFLHADVDPALTQAGAGDNGGIATLLVRLGEALVRTGGADRVITMSRGTPAAALDALADETAGADRWFAPVPLDPDATGATNAWPSRVEAERGIRRVLRRAGRVDALHLRMADVGSLAGHAVAAELGIPVVFSLAPDPHAVIHALDMTGALPRDRFGDVDEREHFWFRTRLVRRLADDAAHRVLFPRPDLRAELHELLGVDVDDEPGRSTVVPEGIDLRVTEAAAAEVHVRDVAATPAGTATSPALDELRRLVGGLPAERRGLPLAISVGRLHRVKGMATVVEAWASDPDLAARCNLLIVGGDLDRPSADERAQLDRIEAVLAAHPHARDGLVLAGHRPNDVVARWLAAAAHGLAPEVAPDGAYVCGSLKEEFGLALLEALAAGLPVVAPHGGGPATYVESGTTGVLVDTRMPSEVAAGMHAALDLAPVPGRRERALATVVERFTIEAMARTLGAVYDSVSPVRRAARAEHPSVARSAWARR